MVVVLLYIIPEVISWITYAEGARYVDPPWLGMFGALGNELYAMTLIQPYNIHITSRIATIFYTCIYSVQFEVIQPYYEIPVTPYPACSILPLN